MDCPRSSPGRHPIDPMRFLLFYEKAPGYAERQKPFAEQHRAYFEERARKGDMVLGGSLEDPLDGSALILFEAVSAAVVESFAKNDPYVQNGIVNKWWVRKWDVVVGSKLNQ